MYDINISPSEHTNSHPTHIQRKPKNPLKHYTCPSPLLPLAT